MIWFVLFSLLFSPPIISADNPGVIAANLSQTITANVTATFQKSFFFLLDPDIVVKKPVRISAKALNATVINPLIVTARQILGVTSFTIPLNDQGYQVYTRYTKFFYSITGLEFSDKSKSYFGDLQFRIFFIPWCPLSIFYFYFPGNSINYVWSSYHYFYFKFISQ